MRFCVMHKSGMNRQAAVSFAKKAAFQFPLAEKMCKLFRFCHKACKKRLVIPPALAYDEKVG